VWERNFPRERRTNVVSPANYLAWGERSESLADMAALSTGAVTLTGDHAPVRVASARVTEGFFPMLGVAPLLGRVFSEEDGEHVIVIDYDVWRGRFGADPGVIGTLVRLNDVDYTIIGVMPEEFRFELEPTETTLGIEADFWRPLPVSEAWREERGRYLVVLARKRPGTSLEEVQAEMDTIAARLEREEPRNTGWGVNVVPLAEQMVGAARPTLVLLFAAVTLMLLLACVNIANLLLGRGIARRREVAIRTALGAGSGRIAGHLLWESAIMSVIAGALGIALAFWGVFLIERFSPVAIPRLAAVSVDGGALTFALLLTAATALVFGVVPALQARHTDVQGVLRGADGGISSMRFRSALVALEVAITVVLLAGSGLLVRTLLSYRAVDPGFDRSGTLTMKLALPDARYATDAAVLAFFDELRERVEALPEVEAVSVVSSVPLTGPHAATSVYADDRPRPADGEAPVADIRIIGGDYFRSMGIPLVAGRTFDSRDNAEQPLRAIISGAAAETLWPGVAPSELLGKVVQVSWGEMVPYEVVGVVGDVRHAALDTGARAMIYWSHHQHPWDVMSLVVRGGELASVQSEIWAMDPGLPAYDVQPVDEILRASVATERFSAVIVGVFAGAALIVASLGVYGVIGFFVTQRRREMGLRLALGASPGNVMSVVIGRGMAMTLVGLVVGIVGVAFATRYIASLLFGVGPFDLVTLATVCSVLAGVAVLACYLPARRASRVDPATVLRFE
jgi:putative ABC transport system permease protein